MTLKLHRIILTTTPSGAVNGWLMPIWNANEDGYRPDQVYLTVVHPQLSKGPHLHKMRTGHFTCIKGNILVVTRLDGVYTTYALGDKQYFQTIDVPAGTAAAIYNVGDENAYVLNLVTPAWTAENPDDWPVEDWRMPTNAIFANCPR